jgi:hypothetical protein
MDRAPILAQSRQAFRQFVLYVSKLRTRKPESFSQPWRPRRTIEDKDRRSAAAYNVHVRRPMVVNRDRNPETAETCNGRHGRLCPASSVQRKTQALKIMYALRRSPASFGATGLLILIKLIEFIEVREMPMCYCLARTTLRTACALGEKYCGQPIPGLRRTPQAPGPLPA